MGSNHLATFYVGYHTDRFAKNLGGSPVKEKPPGDRPAVCSFAPESGLYPRLVSWKQ
jgi:hypothetical protein